MRNVSLALKVSYNATLTDVATYESYNRLSHHSALGGCKFCWQGVCGPVKY